MSYDQHNTGFLRYDDFKAWLVNSPKIMEVFSGSFHEEIWSLEVVRQPSAAHNRRQTGGVLCGLCGGRKKAPIVHLNSALRQMIAGEAGWIYRCNA
jgi:hypothetical protein